MGIVLDIVLVAIIVITVVYGARKGFFKALASLLSGIAALFVAYTFTPALSEYINKTFILDSVAKSIAKTFASIAETGVDAAGNVIYDIQKLISDSQFADIANRAGILPESLSESTVSGYEGIESIAYTIADPLSGSVAEIISFIILFVVAFAVLKILTSVIGLVFKLPVLKNIDKTLGVVFAAVAALFFGWVFAMSCEALVYALSGVAPSYFTGDLIEETFLVELLANVNPVSLLSELFLESK